MIAPDPDFSRLRTVLLRQGEPDRIPFYELFADKEIMEAVLGHSLPDLAITGGSQREAYWKAVIQFYYQLGYDYVPVGAQIDLPRDNILLGKDTAPLAHSSRGWQDEHRGVIETRRDFQDYPWPDCSRVDLSDIRWVARNLPPGMKVIAQSPGVLENVMWLMGYEPFSYALTDDPELVGDMFERIGTLLAAVHRKMAAEQGIGALCMGDDMGYKTGTLVSPSQLRHYVFPWQKKIAEAAHAHDLPMILHSCGNLDAIMDDLIDEVGIDAKHSYEDVIMPITEAKRLWGDRVAVLGGVDMNLLTQGSENQVRARVREIVQACGPGGGFALGTGNSVANYIPVANYLAMLDEGRKQPSSMTSKHIGH
ncbi:MAG: uroporphyrinogen decarboxylase family protein [Candidatus Latescibacterota bacterium]